MRPSFALSCFQPRTAALALLWCPLLALASGDGPGGSQPPTVQFTQCTEFVGVAVVDAAAARALVPARYTLVADAAGARLVVRAADCAAVRVGARPARPGRVAQVGLIIVSPDGTGTDPNTAINNYTLGYVSNSPALVQALRGAGVPAVLDEGLAYTAPAPTAAGGSGDLFVAVAPEHPAAGPRWFLHGTVNVPGFDTSFLANWWVAGPGGRETKMATTLPLISFDFGSQVSFTTQRQGALATLLPGHRIENFVLSFRGAFPAATMVTTVTR
ncbi:hypothetical protein [Rubrivivax rivuli]|uniref:Uncharacterized protein n=1 Tax=Rubrivivax rivuli TaxID=1862385 RepID=A0A437RR91_9BURK|nr:hypothetical protein [Rubrivivax rivuli]RVU49288.1 hypothetical protein EOE66_01560 [Rubrivivax rivuli]